MKKGIKILNDGFGSLYTSLCAYTVADKGEDTLSRAFNKIATHFALNVVQYGAHVIEGQPGGFYEDLLRIGKLAKEGQPPIFEVIDVDENAHKQKTINDFEEFFEKKIQQFGIPDEYKEDLKKRAKIFFDLLTERKNSPS